MPTYDYKCEDCGNVQEEFHPMSGPEYKITCKKCYSAKIKKQLAAPPGYVKGTNTPTKCKKKKGSNRKGKN